MDASLLYVRTAPGTVVTLQLSSVLVPEIKQVCDV